MRRGGGGGGTRVMNRSLEALAIEIHEFVLFPFNPSFILTFGIIHFVFVKNSFQAFFRSFGDMFHRLERETTKYVLHTRP